MRADASDLVVLLKMRVWSPNAVQPSLLEPCSHLIRLSRDSPTITIWPPLAFAHFIIDSNMICSLRFAEAGKRLIGGASPRAPHFVSRPTTTTTRRTTAPPSRTRTRMRAATSRTTRRKKRRRRRKSILLARDRRERAPLLPKRYACPCLDCSTMRFFSSRRFLISFLHGTHSTRDVAHHHLVDISPPARRPPSPSLPSPSHSRNQSVRRRRASPRRVAASAPMPCRAAARTTMRMRTRRRRPRTMTMRTAMPTFGVCAEQ